jgi:acetyltransferase-like isoleucine patch superfamily enzyme
MGACLTKNTDEYNVYMGVPAKSVGKSNDDKISMAL